MPDLAMESSFAGPVCGIDEAGRGPWAGPVVAAACMIDPLLADPALCARIDDSKKLKRKQRDDLHRALSNEGASGFWIGVGQAGVAEIDADNILQATLRAMRRAFDNLRRARAEVGLALPVAALIDGDRAPDLPVETRTVVKGDGQCLSIAAASVVAKARRDAIMEQLDKDCPGYGWDRNAGYGTAEHRAALARLGPTAHHRTSFKPIAAPIARSRAR